MRLILGIMARNEEAMLAKTLPVNGHAAIHALALDTGSEDGTVALFKRHGFDVMTAQWVNDYSATRNLFLALARYRYDPEDWLLMLDADEAMFDADVDDLRKLCAFTSKDLITLPRINLAGAQAQWQEVGSYPDKQARCIRLSASIEFRNRVHEVAYRFGSSQPCTALGEDLFLQNRHIYHYGWCKSPAENWLRSHNYVQMQQGLPLATEAPEWAKRMTDAEWIEQMRKHHAFVAFNKPHPLERSL